MNKFYEAEQLKEKLKDRGSLYGVPSTEFSQEKEIAELILRMPAMITKPNNLFDKGELDKKYKVFKERTQQIQEEEEIKRQMHELQNYTGGRSGIGGGGDDTFDF